MRNQEVFNFLAYSKRRLGFYPSKTEQRVVRQIQAGCELTTVTELYAAKPLSFKTKQDIMIQAVAT